MLPITCTNIPVVLRFLKKYTGRDSTRAFQRVGHSKKALQLLKDLNMQNKSNHVQIDNLNRLFTHEDYFNIHKTLGAITLFMITLRFFNAVSLSMFDLDWYAYYIHKNIRYFLPFLQLSLSLTSLKFKVPLHSSSYLPLIHNMFRAHSILFATRGLLSSAFRISNLNSGRVRQLSMCVCVTTSLFADVVTTRLTVAGDEYTTTRKMPYWEGCSENRRKLHKFFYMWAQIGATSICLSAKNDYAPLSTLVAIQGAAFLMTLCRKSVISPYTYHMIYSTQLMYTMFILVLTEPHWNLWTSQGVFNNMVVLAIMLARLVHVNKYITLIFLSILLY